MIDLLNVKKIGLWLGPVLFLLLILIHPDTLMSGVGWKVAALAIWMITWWITEAVPIPITSLLPMIGFPLLGIFNIKEATAPYASPIIFLFMGGFMIALALERHNLHKRIALNLIKITGLNGNGIILGFMIATAILSMWISNTATAVMMLPIALSVVGLVNANNSTGAGYSKFKTGLMLSIAYAANIGGIGTLIGTPPNVVLAGYINSFYNVDIGFLDWMKIGIPVMLLLLLVTYLLLTRVFYKNNLGRIEGADIMFKKELDTIGRWSNEERAVASIFGLTAMGWILKQQINQLIGQPLLTDTTTAMIGGVAMFMVPIDKKGKMLMQWEDMIKLPWGILILFGGGLCLAKAMESVGIVNLIGDAVASYQGVSQWTILILTTSIVLFMTELMSNVALITIFIPVLIGIASGMGINPYLLCIPATMAASCAFMMPISTPPNAVVFSSGFIRMRQMIKIGFALNIISIIVMVLAGLTVVSWVFG